MTDCVFCKIVAGEIPASVVHEDAHAIAFMDVGQVNPGHVLVATKAHLENVFELDDERAGAVFQAAARVARAVRAAYSPHGVTLYQANGKAAFQTVFHFHIHVLPRWADDGVRLTWPAKQPSRAELDSSAARIRAQLA